MRLYKILAVLLVLGGGQIAEPALAQQKYLGNFKNWFAYREDQGAVRICYIASIPKNETGKYNKRGETYILVTHRPHESKQDVFELNAGYTYKKNSAVNLNIDGQLTKLITKDGRAWAETAKADRSLAAAMAKGRQLIVTGISSRGTKTIDTYSLAGFTAAYRAIGEACGVK